MFVKPVVKRSETEINKITGFIMGVRKFGKTTLWSDMIREKFGDPSKGLLVSCGLEHGTNMIDNINTTHIDTYKDMMELKKWLIETKGDEHDIQMICFDSAEELFSIFETETIRRSNLETGKQVRSIKAAYSGFTNGEKECAKLVKKFFNELYTVGIMPWAIGHTKLKTVRDKGSMDEEGFQKLGSSLIADYESVCSDCFDIIVTGLVNREIEERGSGDSTKRYVKEAERRLYFRGNEIVEAGGRMKDLSVPEYIVFDKPNMAKDFIETIENALKAGRVDGDENKSSTSNKKTSKKSTPTPTSISDPEEDSEVADEDFDLFDEEETLQEEEAVVPIDKETLTKIRSNFKSADADTKSQVKSVLSNYNGKLASEMLPSDVKKIKKILGIKQKEI